MVKQITWLIANELVNAIELNDLELKAPTFSPTTSTPRLSRCRSVISYKTDQKPLFSTDIVANAGWCLYIFFHTGLNFNLDP